MATCLNASSNPDYNSKFLLPTWCEIVWFFTILQPLDKKAPTRQGIRSTLPKQSLTNTHAGYSSTNQMGFRAFAQRIAQSSGLKLVKFWHENLSKLHTVCIHNVWEAYVETYETHLGITVPSGGFPMCEKRPYGSRWIKFVIIKRKKNFNRAVNKPFLYSVKRYFNLILS